MYKLFFIISFKLIFASAVLGQDISQTLRLADHYHSQGMYDAAVEHFRRALYFSDDADQPDIYPRIAESLFLAGKYQESDFFYGLSYHTAHSDSLKYHFALQRALSHIMRTDYDQALQQLFNVDPEYSDHFREEYYFVLGIISLYKHNYEQAASNFRESFSDTESVAKVDQLFKAAKLHRPRPEIARRLSMFLPGLGQAYAGDTKSAVNSFVLNAALATLALYAALNYTFIDGVVSVFPWLVRYYLGGGKNAEMTAMQIKQMKVNTILLDLIQLKN